MPNQPEQIFLYDTTLRDGSQRRDISYSLNDKIKITYILDELGVSYIEGGWPGSNETDAAYFQYFKQQQQANKKLKHSRIVAFGSTRKAFTKIEQDQQIQSLLDADTDTVTLVAKSWTLHVEKVLQTTLEENLQMIFDSVAYFKQHDKEVILDAEHFFDAWKADKDYALCCLQKAQQAGADWLVLCDTNGGSLADEIAETIQSVKKSIDVKIGVHTHNDCELAVANSLAAVKAGATQIQGTINGYGERCGNANLVSIIPTLTFKMDKTCLPQASIKQLSLVSQQISELANVSHDPFAAYVGHSAFAHKGGIHVAAVEKIAASYEHIDPETVGNNRQIVVSDLSGRSNVRLRAENLGLQFRQDERKILENIKQLESQGLTLDGADGTFELAVRRLETDYRAPFKLIETHVHSNSRAEGGFKSQASVKISCQNKTGTENLFHTIAESDGPVEAIDLAMRKALEPVFPELSSIKLTDYKVRILDPDQAASATTRVWIEASVEKNVWSTVGCSSSIIEASSYALADSFELFLLKNSNGRSKHGNQAA
ncbi:MAG TPA: citramalate synthase [Aeromonadales bacterium]|nr:citramalate synthase [Aeromonadales bacterium]